MSFYYAVMFLKPKARQFYCPAESNVNTLAVNCLHMHIVVNVLKAMLRYANQISGIPYRPTSLKTLPPHISFLNSNAQSYTKTFIIIIIIIISWSPKTFSTDKFGYDYL